MNKDPYGFDEFLGTDHPEPGEGWSVQAGIIAAFIVFTALAVGVGGGIGWLVARYGPETAFDMSRPYYDWAARVAVRCPTTTASIRPLLADDRLTRKEMEAMRTIHFAARDVCDAPAMPSGD